MTKLWNKLSKYPTNWIKHLRSTEEPNTTNNLRYIKYWPKNILAFLVCWLKIREHRTVIIYAKDLVSNSPQVVRLCGCKSASFDCACETREGNQEHLTKILITIHKIIRQINTCLNHRSVSITCGHMFMIKQP